MSRNNRVVFGDAPPSDAPNGGAKKENRPRVTSIVPRDASPNGGVLITIFGENLRSTQLDISGVKDETADQGENFRVWFEHTKNGIIYMIPCDVDRMFGLFVKQLPGQDWLVCKTRKFPIWAKWWLRLQIDDGDIIRSSGIDFMENEGPTVTHIFPQAASPAKPKNHYDYEGVFYTQWFDTDENEDGVEDESIQHHMKVDRNIFQKCFNPLGIEVVEKSTDTYFTKSANENADGNAIPTYMDGLQGRVSWPMESGPIWATRKFYF